MAGQGEPQGSASLPISASVALALQVNCPPNTTPRVFVFPSWSLGIKLGSSCVADMQTCKVVKTKESLSWDASLLRIGRARGGRALPVVYTVRTGCLVIAPLIYVT